MPLSLIALIATALAHHGTATTRVDRGVRSTAAIGELLPTPRLDVGIDVGARRFGRTLSGTSVYDGSALGSVNVQSLTGTARVTLKSRTTMMVQVPVAHIATQAPTGEVMGVNGMGDVTATVGQDLLVLDRAEGRRSPALVWSARGGLLAPTGHYDTTAVFQITEVNGTGEGGLDLTTYDTRATLGMGAWAVSAGTSLNWMPTDRLGLQLAGGTLIPASRTRDEVQWGADVDASLNAQLGFVGNRLLVGGQLAARHHARDEIEVEDEDTGELVRDRVGGRDQASVGLRVQGRLTRTLTCSMQASAPVWQRAGGIQLMESWSTSASCSVGIASSAP